MATKLDDLRAELEADDAEVLAGLDRESKEFDKVHDSSSDIGECGLTVLCRTPKLIVFSKPFD